MVNPNDDGPISPMKKLKVLSEQYQNIQPVNQPMFPVKQQVTDLPKALTVPLKPIVEIEPIVTKTTENPESTENIEPLLQETPTQYVIFPIAHDDMWAMYKKLVDNFWSVTDTINQLDMLVLSYEEKQFFKIFASIFASPSSAGLVNENFAEHFSKEINVTEAKFFYGHSLFAQNIHYEMYNKLLESMAQKEDERIKLFKVVEGYEAVVRKRKWLTQWQQASFADQLVASACLHGLFFLVLDIVYKWFASCPKKSHNHELLNIFERMLIDQMLQRDFACLMVSHLNVKPSQERMKNMINDAAKVELDFLLNGVKVDLIDVKSDDIIVLIDKKATELKNKLMRSFDEKRKNIVVNNNENKQSADETARINKDHYKLTFDDDF